MQIKSHNSVPTNSVWKDIRIKFSFKEVFVLHPQGLSAAAHPQVDFLKGEAHRKHPGVTNLKTLRLPEELQTAARSIINSMLNSSFLITWYLHCSWYYLKIGATFNPSTCRSSGTSTDWPHSQPYKLPMEPKTSSRGFNSEAKSCEPRERTLAKSDGKEGRWVYNNISKYLCVCYYCIVNNSLVHHLLYYNVLNNFTPVYLSVM